MGQYIFNKGDAALLIVYVRANGFENIFGGETALTFAISHEEIYQDVLPTLFNLEGAVESLITSAERQIRLAPHRASASSLYRLFKKEHGIFLHVKEAFENRYAASVLREKNFLSVSRTDEGEEKAYIQEAIGIALLSYTYSIDPAGELVSRYLPTARQLKERGAKLKELVACYSSYQLKLAGYIAKDFKEAGYPAKELRLAFYHAKELKRAGYSLKELKEAGCVLTHLIDAHYSVEDLKNVGYSAKELRQAEVSAIRLKDAGFTRKQLTQAGYTLTQLIEAGYPAK